MTATRPKLYISGPMGIGPAGILNADAFDMAAELLRTAGYEVVNPIDKFTAVDPDKIEETPHTAWLHQALKELLDCEAIAYLEGWRETHDSQLEVSIGRTLNWDSGRVAWWVERQGEWPPFEPTAEPPAGGKTTKS